MPTVPPRFRYLNRDGRWPDFQLRGLRVGDDGALRLDTVPRLEGAPPADLADLPAPRDPAGIAVLPDGTLYFTDPERHRLLWIDGCAECPAPVPCTGGPSDQPGGLQHPRGLLYHAGLNAIMVADSSNHRIQLFDPETHQLRDIWGGFGSAPGQLISPLTLAADAEGNVYTVDSGNRRVQKFNSLGYVQPAFWETVHQDIPDLTEPSDVAVRQEGDSAEVFILDAGRRTIWVVDADGNLLKWTDAEGASHVVSFGAANLHQPMGMAIAGDALHVGDNNQCPEIIPPEDPCHAVRRIQRFKRTASGAWVYVGEAIGYTGPVAALALDGRGGLWVHPGGGTAPECAADGDGAGFAPIRLAAAGGYASKGFAWGGRFLNPSFRMEQWHRIQALFESPIPVPGTHFQLHISWTKPNGDPPGDTASQDPPWPADPTGLVHTGPGSPLATRVKGEPGKWLPLLRDVAEGLVPGQPDEALWIGVELTSEGLASPVLPQMRIDFDYETLLKHLPAIYQADDGPRDFGARFLTLFESLFRDVESATRGLPAYFDPGAVPADFLPWLAGWLAQDLPEDWDQAHKRQAIAEAFAAYARRGTAEGLRLALRRMAGVDVRIEEPILHAAWWSLAGVAPDGEVPDDAGAAQYGAEARSMLGFTTMLAPAEPQGALVGTTAVLDASHLITGDEYGAPLFEDVAHQFTVLMYQGATFSDHARDEVRAVIEREQPAHTTVHLCVVEPRMRVGFQARIGVDTVVAGPPLPTGLDAPGGPAAELVLGGEPAGRVGEQSRIGQTTRLDGTA